MGMTNIRFSHDLLQRVRRWGGPASHTALLPQAGGRIINMCDGTISAAALKDLEEILGKSGSSWWNTTRLGTSVLSERTAAPPPRFEIPMVTLTPALSEFWLPSSEPAGEPKSEEPTGLVYFAVVEGTAGAAARKIEVAYPRERMAIQLLHELMNGYSVIFCGVAIATEFRRRESGFQVQWQKVESLEEMRRLQEQNNSGNNKTKIFPPAIGVLC